MIVSAPCLRARSASVFRVGLHAGRRLGVHEREDLGVGIGLERVLDFLRIHRGAPAVVDDDGGAAAALHVLDHPAAEDAVPANDDLVAGIDHVHEAHLHPHRPGAGHRERQRVVRLERVAQRLLQLLHHFHEHRVEVADGRLAHRRKHPWMNLRGTGSHQMSLRWIERRDLLPGCVILAGHGNSPAKIWRRGDARREGREV